MKKTLNELLKYSFMVNRDFFKITPWSCIFVIICYIIFMTYNISITILTKKIYENAYLLNENIVFKDLFYKYVILFILAFIIKNIFEMIINMPRMVGIYTKAKYHFDRMVTLRLTEIPFVFFDNTKDMEEWQRVNSVIQNNILQRIYLTFLDIVFNVMTIIGTIAILISFDVYLLPVAIISVIPFFITRLLRGKELYTIKWYQAIERRNANYLWGLFLSREHIQEMKLYDSYNHIFKKWNSSVCNLYEEEFKHRRKDAKSLLACNVIRIIGIFFNIGLTLYLVHRGRLEMSEFVASLTSFYVVQNGVMDLFVKISNQSIYLKYAKDFYSFLEKNADENGGKSISALNESVKTSNLSFMYPNADDFSLDEVSVCINKTEKVVIVGENGSGKTTLVNMLLGLYKPSKGQVFIDDCDISYYNKQSLHNLVSLVPQNFCKYNMSLKENVIIGSMEKFKREKEATNVINILYELGIRHMGETERFDGLLGKEFGGGELSGGEWQKIAIARALYKDSDLYLLDEPTAALDPIMENEILKDFVKITKDRTAVIISHRVGLCKLVDKIIVMKAGKIECVGTHNELLDSNDYYRHLYTEQQKWYE